MRPRKNIYLTLSNGDFTSWRCLQGTRLSPTCLQVTVKLAPVSAPQVASATISLHNRGYLRGALSTLFPFWCHLTLLTTTIINLSVWDQGGGEDFHQPSHTARRYVVGLEWKLKKKTHLTFNIQLQSFLFLSILSTKIRSRHADVWKLWRLLQHTIPKLQDVWTFPVFNCE